MEVEISIRWSTFFLFVFACYGVTDNANTNYQLIFNPTLMTWSGAATWCELKNGSLVTVDSESVVLMIDYYKTNDWSTLWTTHVWAGLYSYSTTSGVWHGTCGSLNYTNWAPAQTYSSASPCIYISHTDLLWYYDDCLNRHHVVCQVPFGDCTFDDGDMQVDKAFTPLGAVGAATLDDCKSLCNSYADGNIQCWAIKYQASSQNCYMYVSVNPTEYLSNKANPNQNMFYSTRNCFSSSIVQENEPTSTMNIPTIVEKCDESTTLMTSTQIPSSSSSAASTNIETTNMKQPTTSMPETTQSTVSSTSQTITAKTSIGVTSQTTTGVTSQTITGVTSQSPTEGVTSHISTILNTDASTHAVQNNSTTLSISTSTSVSVGATTQETLKVATGVTSFTTQSTSSDYFTLRLSTESCTFECPCNFPFHNMTYEMLAARLEELRTTLTIDKKKTNSYIRAHTSAKDERPSAKAVGSVAVIFIVLIFGSLVAIDVCTLFQHLKCKRLKKTFLRRGMSYLNKSS